MGVDRWRNCKSAGIVTRLSLRRKGEREKREGGNKVGNMSWEEDEGHDCAQRSPMLFPLVGVAVEGILRTGRIDAT